MNHASLFSGIGGFDLAAEWRGWTNVFTCEIEEKASLILKKNFPETTHYRDILKLDAKKYNGRIDILTGGFPCQPFSVAGRRKGEEDDRHLWPEMLRIIKEIEPTYVIGENVPGIVSVDNGRTFKSILSDLECQGYKVEVFNIEASSVRGWHRRARIWIVAYRNINKIYSNNRKERRKGRGFKQIPALKKIQRIQDGRIYADVEGRPELPTPILCRAGDGIPNRMERTGQYGNAVVPQLVYRIFGIIDQLNHTLNQ